MSDVSKDVAGAAAKALKVVDKCIWPIDIFAFEAKPADKPHISVRLFSISPLRDHRVSTRPSRDRSARSVQG